METPQLHKIETYRMDYGELERLILLHYGFEYDYVSGEETNNSSHKLFQDVDGSSYGIWEREEFDMWLNLKGVGEGFKAEALLNDMVKKGVLPAGNYLIETFW